MVLIISGTNLISGAEYVLADYLENSCKDKFIILTSKNKEVTNFYKKLKICNVISLNCLTPIGASKKRSIINKLKKLHKLFSSKSQIKKYIHRFNVNKVMGNNTLDIIYSIWVKKNLNTEYYQYIHDMIEKDSLISKLILRFDKYIDKYFVVSEAVKKSLSSIGINQDKLILIYNGLNPINYVHKSRSNKKIIGFLGALSDRKSPMTFVEFIKKSNYKGIMAYHMIEDNILEKIKLEIKKYNLNIDLIGKVERCKLKEFYNKVDFLFVPSKRDPLPTVVLEAFNYSTPVIGRDIDGISEMIDEELNGYLFKSDNDFDYIISKINNLDNEIYNKMCFSANSSIKSKFNLNQKVNKLNKYFFKTNIN